MKKTLIVLVAVLALIFSFAIAEEACDHSWDPHKISNATCDSAEMWEETCSKCGVSNGTYPQGSALGHNFVETKLTDATCTAAATYKKECTNGCGESSVYSQGSTLPHSYKTVTVTPADCDNAASVKDVCSVCGAETAVRTEGEAEGHNWIIKELKGESNCEQIAYYEECSKCGDKTATWFESTGKDHVWEIITTPATCKAPLTHTEKCMVCKAINQVWSEGEALAHVETIEKGYEATCTSTGLTDKIYCSACGEIFQDHSVIAMISHTVVTVPAKESTCIEHGYTESTKCSVCGTVITAATELPLVDHKWERERVVEPTETERGYTEYRCTVCGKSDRRNYTAALGVVADVALNPYGEGIVTDLDDVAMPYTAEVDEEIGRVIITATDKDVLRELHISLALIEQWKAEGFVEVEFIVDEAEIVVPFAVFETAMMEDVKAAFPATLTGYIVTLDPTAVNANGDAGVLVKVDLTADTADEDGIEMEVTDAIEGMMLSIGGAAPATVVGGGVYTA